ncbi:hypothetical protein PIROE2DRAFT_17143 [Piromyces sp. E2]|nr:hypothetical protein PIROE2DRAFT_17143 [Piromyces sp. E2]|eukprot:OUM57766.1 hypothetical protein PIROE2DRAFT_17143 [Piromyces sp. E2]
MFLKLKLIFNKNRDLSKNKLEGHFIIPNTLLELNVENNKFTSLSIENCPKDAINAENNNFDADIFNNMKNCSNLTYLSLNSNKQIKEIPPSIQYLISLEELYLNNADISNISDNIYKLQKLNKLSIEDNPNLNIEIKSFQSKSIECSFNNSPIKCIHSDACNTLLPSDIKSCSDEMGSNKTPFSFGWIITIIVLTLLTVIGFIFIIKKVFRHDNDIIITKIKKSPTREEFSHHSSIYSNNSNSNSNSNNNYNELHHSLSTNSNYILHSSQPLIHHYSIASNISPSFNNNDVPTLTYLASLSDINSDNDILPSYIDIVNNNSK